MEENEIQGETEIILKIEDTEKCKCIIIEGHFTADTWMLWPRDYKKSPGYLAIGDFTQNPFIWLHYVESNDGSLVEDDVLKSTDSKYWSIHDAQRYFLGNFHCEQNLFTYQYPNLKLPTRHGRHLWTAHAASKLPSSLYQKYFNISLENTLKKIESNSYQMDRLIISDQLIKLSQMHYFKRKKFMEHLLNILRSTDSKYWSIHDAQRYFLGNFHCEQNLFTYQYPNLKLPTRHGRHLWTAHAASKLPSSLYQKYFNISLENTLKNRLQLVSLENLSSSRLEGVRLIQQLACFNSESLKYLFLWRFVHPRENPIMINYSYITGSGRYIPRPDTKNCFLQNLAALRNLKVLALEFSYLGDETGSALTTLLPILKKPHFRLQLICRRDQIPGRQDVGLGGGGYGIPDTAWRRVTVLCPDLNLTMTLFRIRHYDDAILFMTPSMPLRELHLEYGIDLNQSQRQHSDLCCLIRNIAFFYGHSLVSLSIHQWRFEKFPFWRLFELMPHLVRFHYVGEVEEKDLRRMLTLVACGVCDKLRYIMIQVQDEEHKTSWVQNLNDEFSPIMQLLDIIFCLVVYKI